MNTTDFCGGRAGQRKDVRHVNVIPAQETHAAKHSVGDAHVSNFERKYWFGGVVDDAVPAGKIRRRCRGTVLWIGKHELMTGEGGRHRQVGKSQAKRCARVAREVGEWL